MNKDDSSVSGLILGIVFTLTGLMMFFSIPAKMQEIETLKQYSSGMNGFLRISFYIISILLTGGGLRKLFLNVKSRNVE